MPKRLLLTTALSLILGTAAFAQTSTDPSKTDASKPAAQQTEKTKPLSRVEKWQADKQTEAAEKNIDQNTGAAPASSVQNSQTPTAPNQPAANTAQSHTPATNNGNTNQAQNSPPASATKTMPNAGAANAQPQNQQTQNNTPAANTPANSNQPTNSQAQTPNAAPATNQNQQAQQPQNTDNNAASANSSQTQTNISAGVSVTDPQRTRISESVTKLNVQPVTKVNFSVSIGSPVPRDVRLHTVPTDVVEIVPQYRDYKFFVVREEIVIVEPSTMKIVTVLPRHSGTTTAATTTTTSRTKLTDSERTTIKKNAAQPRRERAATSRIERDDPRTARAESRRELRVGDRVPETVELYDMPDRAYREAPTLREYRYMNRGSRTYVIEPHERTIIEELD